MTTFRCTSEQSVVSLLFLTAPYKNKRHVSRKTYHLKPSCLQWHQDTFVTIRTLSHRKSSCLCNRRVVHVMPSIFCSGETDGCTSDTNFNPATFGVLQTNDGRIKSPTLELRDIFMGDLSSKYFISCQNLFCSLILRCATMLCQRPIFKASLAGRALASWEAPNNGIIFDEVLRVDRPFLPLHKHRLKCVQLCMMPPSVFLFTLIIAGDNEVLM